MRQLLRIRQDKIVYAGVTSLSFAAAGAGLARNAGLAISSKPVPGCRPRSS